MMFITSRPSQSINTNGFIIVAALWIIAALATLSLIYAAYIDNTKQAFAENDDRIKAEAAISASLALTAYQLQSKQHENAPVRGHLNFHLRPANVTVNFRPEAARIDLNAAPKELLVGIFIALGEPNEAASIYADRILEWRTPPRNALNNDEASLYQNAGLSYSPRQAPFASVSELWLVRDLPTEVTERLLPYVTIFNGEPGISLLDAAPTIIAALPEMTPDRLKAILNQRLLTPYNEEAIKSLLSPLQRQFVSPKSTSTRATIEVHFDNGRKVEAEAVINLIDEGRVPYRVLFWRDDLDADLKPKNVAALQ